MNGGRDTFAFQARLDDVSLKAKNPTVRDENGFTYPRASTGRDLRPDTMKKSRPDEYVVARFSAGDLDLDLFDHD